MGHAEHGLITPLEMLFTEFLEQEKIVLMDGALGTELERRGYKTTLPLWTATANIEAPDIVAQIHLDYLYAGARIITANTFRTTPYTLAKAGRQSDAYALTIRAVELAREAAEMVSHPVCVAASLAPLEDCYSPHLMPEPSVIEIAYSQQIDLLTSAAPDLILLETMINLAEIDYATAMLRDQNLPYGVSLTADIDGCLLDGTHLNTVLDLVRERNPLFIALNCRDPRTITQNLPWIIAGFNGPVGAYANGSGMPGGPSGWQWDTGYSPVQHYVDEAKKWIEAGARIIGGCCGTTPGHIKELNKLVMSLRPDQS